MPMADGGLVGATSGGGVSASELAAALTGMTFTLEVDGQPLRAIARAEATSAVRRAVR